MAAKTAIRIIRETGAGLRRDRSSRPDSGEKGRDVTGKNPVKNRYTTVNAPEPREYRKILQEKFPVTKPRPPGFNQQLPPCCSLPPVFTAALEIPVDSRSFAASTFADDIVAPVDPTAHAPLSDHALMLAVRDGRLDALGELFERHHGPLFGFLVKFTGHRAAAEDIAQVVFERMLKYRHTYRDDGSFTAWMYHLARRCAADHFRKANAAPYATDPTDLHHHADDRPDAGQTATTGDDYALLHAALGRLDHGDREVLLLSRFQELSFAEIAGILECSVGAAKVRAHRALHSLRTVYLRLQKEPLS